MPKLGVAFPAGPGEEPLTALPLVPPMGWTESPPFFCVGTETVIDLANSCSPTAWDPPVHPLEQAVATPAPHDNTLRIDVPPPSSAAPTGRASRLPPPAALRRRPRRGSQPLECFDVYVDDEMCAAQGTKARLNKLRRRLLHINDQVFRPNTPSDEHWRRETISLKKLLKGDASWSTVKVILGWPIDTLAGTVELPPHRRQRLLDILADTIPRRRVSNKQCCKLLGEVRSVLSAASGGAGLLSNLQHSLATSSDSRTRIDRHARRQLQDLHTLAVDIVSRPARLAELFPAADGHFCGARNAAKPGFGGVPLPGPQDDFPPAAWQVPLPLDLQAAIVLDDNPAGTVTNSDLEPAGTVLQEAVVGIAVDVRECTVHMCCDNTPAISRRGKGSVTTDGPGADTLRMGSPQQRQLRHVSRFHCIPGPANLLADTCSRKFSTPSHLLAVLTRLAPQTKPWRMLHPPPDIVSSLISALRRQKPAKLSLASAPVPRTPSGPSVGCLSHPTSESKTLSSPVSKKSSTCPGLAFSTFCDRGSIARAKTMTLWF